MKRSLLRWVSVLMIIALALTLVAGSALAKPSKKQQQEDPGLGFFVVFDNETVPADFAAFARSVGARVETGLARIGVITAYTSNPTSFLKATIARADVCSVGPALNVGLGPVEIMPFIPAETDVAEPGTARYWDRYQWDMKQITNQGESYKINSGSKDVVVGVIDTGIDIYHPDLTANIVSYESFVPGADSDKDGNGHGTHVAGTIGANGNVLGVAPNVGLSAYRVFGDTGGARQEHIIAAIIEAANDGVDVINMSLGGFRVKGQWYYVDPETGERVKLGNDAADVVAYHRAIQYAIKKNVTVVVAAGNDAQDLSKRTDVTRWYQQDLYDQGYTMYEIQGATFTVPAGIPGVISVSATVGGFGIEDRLASYSNYGSGAIDIAGQGGDGVADHLFEGVLIPFYYHYILNTYPTTEGGYVFMAGTSMAAPHVAGAAAAYIDYVYQTTGQKPTPSQVKSHLLQTAVDYGKPGYDGLFGHGIVNVYKALTTK